MSRDAVYWLHEPSGEFGGFYNEWRRRRVAKLEQVFGTGWFAGKKVLELGCGYGNIGRYFQALGADVTFSDARTELLDEVKRRDPAAKVILLDQNTDWSLGATYDLVIHFGVLYNLDEWARDLALAAQHSKWLAVETAVNRFVNRVEFKIKAPTYDHTYHGPFNSLGSLPSELMVEDVLAAQGMSYRRYDDKDLNFDTWKYDVVFDTAASTDGVVFVSSWHHPDVYGCRRLWVASN